MRPKLSGSPRFRLSASEISVPGKTFVSYERKETFHIISYQGEISLVNLSKCFLGNRDNFCPYEQALSTNVKHPKFGCHVTSLCQGLRRSPGSGGEDLENQVGIYSETLYSAYQKKVNPNIFTSIHAYFTSES